jgi:putative transposase
MGRMVTRHRHTESEIAAKLATADGMAAQGVLHRDIAKLLGISVMTYHRWRKARGATVRSMSRLAPDTDQAEFPADREEIGQIRELKIENSRLRRLVTDLLLEKLELEENLRGVSRGRTQLDHSQYATAVARQVAQK